MDDYELDECVKGRLHDTLVETHIMDCFWEKYISPVTMLNHSIIYL